MSVHSAQRSQYLNAAYSNQNNPNHSMSPHSMQLQKAPISSPHQEWVAAYIDGQYYLTDPESIHRLKNIEAEIQQERDKLQKMAKQQNQNQSLSNSFISAPQERAERHSNHSFCGTEFNQHRQMNKREKVKNQLEKEEDRYRQKIKNMEKQKNEMKKSMKPMEQSQQAVIKDSLHPEQAKSHRKSSKKEEGDAERKTAQKSVRGDSKEKSFHKSRIQNSIKKTAELNMIADQEIKPMEQEKSKKSHRIEDNADRSVTPVEDSHQPIDFLAPPSVKGKKGENGSVKGSEKMQYKSVKQSSKQQQLLQHDAKQSVRPSEKKEHSLREPSKKGVLSEKQPSKKQQQQGFHHQQKEVNNQQSENQGSRAYSKRETDKKSTIRKQSHPSQKQVKNEDENIKVKVIRVDSIDSSKVQKQSQEVKSIKSVNSRLIQQNEYIPTPKTQSIHQEKTKSVKSHLQAQSKISALSQEEQKMLESGVVEDAKSKSHVHSYKSSIAKEQDLKSKKSEIQKEEVRSRKPSANKQDDAKSKRSQALNAVSIPFVFDDGKSKKSGFQNSENGKKDKSSIRSKRSQIQPALQDNLLNEEEDKSKKSSIMDKEISGHRSRVDSIKQVMNHPKEPKAKEQLRSQKSNNKNGKEASQSGQWSRATQSNPNANIIKFEKGSAKNSSSIQQNQQSMNQSSHLKLQQLNNELVQEQVQKLDVPYQVNMRKKKQNDNQSEKKSRSFIIHSRGGSVKDRSEKLSVNHGKFSAKKQMSSVQNESVTKQQINKLQEQVGLLREKLLQIEQRQQLMQKVEVNFSKINSNHMEDHKDEAQNLVNVVPLEERNEVEEIEKPIEEPIDNPLAALLGEIVKGSKIQPKLQLESSIIQVNTQQQLRKKVERDSQANQKLKLKQEIARLKRIIRDMQIQKIKSIDHENDLGESTLLKKESKSIADSNAIRNSRIGGESIAGIEGMQTQKRFWGKSRQEEAGRIIKNSFLSDQQEDISPRRGSQRIKFSGNQDDVIMDPDELPSQSNSKRNSKFRKEAQQMSLIERIHDKERDFHHFVQSSHVFAEEPKNQQMEVQQESTGLIGFQQFSKISVGNPPNNFVEGKMNYSRMVEQFRKNNPQEEEVLPQIHMRDIKIPQLPPTPSPQQAQQQLLALAKQTYQIFGMNVEQEDRQLCVKKYKNCVFFTLTNCPDSILWHFSGKFYMGGWRVGEPGEGEKHGEGLEVVPEKHVYRGQFLNGKKNGTGILKLANGNIYDGQWIDGAKNGRGVYFDSATRVLFSGEWKDGRKDGQGFLKLSDKEYYHGTFVKSVKQGFGSEVFVNGDRYRGEYHGGKFHGKGKYTWANGSCYQGQFVEGVRQGQGSWKSAKNNGDVYVGSYENDKKNGYGRYVWANGCMFEGGFANDVKHGKGRLTYQDGKEIKGVWEEGNLITTQNDKRPADHEEQPLRRSVKVATFGGYHPATARRF